jgi:hypothetical protein
MASDPILAKLQAAKQTMANANAFTNSVHPPYQPAPAPQPQQPTGIGHAIGVAFANAHGNDHQGFTPEVQDIAGGLKWRQQQAAVANPQQ